jgi:alpha-D-ribose 1-methylphosphonate 5-triphosphate synthase subunit PhnG
MSSVDQITEVTPGHWLRALSALEPEKLTAQVAALTEKWHITDRSLPQSGLAMLKIRESAGGEPFYLGEIPLTTTWLEIRDPDGGEAQGAAQIMADNLDLARTLAICDGILAKKLVGHEIVRSLVRQGWQRCQAEDQKRRTMLATTRVDFSLLDDVGEGDGN